MTSLAATAAAYAKSIKILANINADRKQARLREMQLDQQQIKVLRGSCEELAKSMGFKSLAELHRRTSNPEITLKLLGAHYRRMKILLDYTKNNKALLPTAIDG